MTKEKNNPFYASDFPPQSDEKIYVNLMDFILSVIP